MANNISLNQIGTGHWYNWKRSYFVYNDQTHSINSVSLNLFERGLRQLPCCGGYHEVPRLTALIDQIQNDKDARLSDDECQSLQRIWNKAHPSKNFPLDLSSHFKDPLEESAEEQVVKSAQNVKKNFMETAGIYNNGVNCFLNATMQALKALPGFKQFVEKPLTQRANENEEDFRKRQNIQVQIKSLLDKLMLSENISFQTIDALRTSMHAFDEQLPEKGMSDGIVWLRKIVEILDIPQDHLAPSPGHHEIGHDGDFAEFFKEGRWCYRTAFAQEEPQKAFFDYAIFKESPPFLILLRAPGFEQKINFTQTVSVKVKDEDEANHTYELVGCQVHRSNHAVAYLPAWVLFDDAHKEETDLKGMLEGGFIRAVYYTPIQT